MDEELRDKLIEGLSPEIKKKYNLYTKSEKIINDLLKEIKEDLLEAQETPDNGEFYSNTWNLMGKYIMLVKAEKGSYHKVDVYCSVHGCSEVAIDYYHATILGLLFKLPLCKKHFGYLTDECEGPIK
jgi:hypothetical protein